MNDIRTEYFNWLVSKIDPDKNRFQNHTKLLAMLDSRDFKYVLGMDGNRYDDGIDLRYRFGMEEGIDDRIIASELDIRPCSVFEMMVALALRCEEHIMGNDEAGDRTGIWFEDMLRSLGLYGINDRAFQNARSADRSINHMIDTFLRRDYAPDGEGGLVTLHNCTYDLRKVEIWYQMMWYLNERYC